MSRVTIPTLTDRAVPFYQIVTRGSVVNAIPSVNLSSNRRASFLKALESGSSDRIDEQIQQATAERDALIQQKENQQKYIEDLKNADAATLEKQLEALKQQQSDAQAPAEAQCPAEIPMDVLGGEE